MYSRASSRIWRLGVALALCALSACGTEEFQLEPMYVALRQEDVELLGSKDGACLSIPVFFTGSNASYDLRFDGRPLRWHGTDDEVGPLGGYGGAAFFCVSAGTYDVSLVRRGKTVASTGKISMGAGSQLVLTLHGEASAPRIKAAEIDLNPPGEGLRRLRITNVTRAKQPVQLIYFDDQDVEVGRSDVIAYGDTWSGTISTSITGWRREPSQPAAFPIYSNFAIFSSAENRLCSEAPPAGLLIMSAPVAEPGEDPYEEELYLQRPPVCTLDPSCPDDIVECWPHWVPDGPQTQL